MKIKLFYLILLIFCVHFVKSQNKINYSQASLLGQADSKLYIISNGLLPEVSDAFEKMKIAALNSGHDIEIVSAYRSYNRQRDIWNRKYVSNEIKGFSPVENINKIIEYSTLPGTSRHHWGTDIDIIDGSQTNEGDLLVPKKFHGSGPFNKLRKWMESNAEKFGFLKPYNQDPERKGFNYEPWHYSYAKKSIPMLNAYLELDAISLIKDRDLLGADLLDSKFIKTYLNTHILGIDKALL